MNFFQRTPFLRLLLSLISGIVVFQYIKFGCLMKLTLLLFVILLTLTAFLLKKTKYAYKFRWLFGVGILILFFLIGYVVSEIKQKKTDFPYINQKELFVVDIQERPLIKPNSIVCQVQVNGFKTDTQFVKISSKALIYVSKDSLSLNLKKGDILSIKTTFQNPPKSLNPEGFDYDKFLFRKGIAATAFVRQNEWRLLFNNQTFSIVALAETWRDRLLSIYQKLNLPNDQFAVLAALTLGYKDALEPDVAENYSHSGAMHILAVSGLHVGVVFWIFQTVFTFLFKKLRYKYLSTVFTICALWLYAFITGLPPSVIRATTMFSLVSVGTSIGRKAQIYNTISVSAFMILLWNSNILFDVGFQLSYAAVIGIVYLQPKISSLIYLKHKWMKWWWDLTAVSLAAQITTLPLSIYYFSQFPNYFLLSNYIAIPLATFIIYIAVAYLVLSPVLFLAYIPALLLKVFLRVLNLSIAFIHDLPNAISMWYISGFQVFLLFTLLLFFVIYMDNRKYWSIFTFIFIILFFVCNISFINLKSYNINRMIVFADNKNSHINIISNRNNIVFTTDSIVSKKSFQKYWGLNHLKSANYINQVNSRMLTINDKRIFILTDDSLNRMTAIEPINVDFLIIGNAIKVNAKQIISCVNPKTCIVDSSISSWYTDNIKEICTKNGIEFYSVAEHGAYVYDF